MDQREYKRYLSAIDVWALSLGCIIGWGAFVMPGTTFLPVAGPAGTVIAMILSVVIMLVIGANYSYLMNLQPGIGGVYAYTKSSYGRDHAFLSSWFLCLAYLALIPQNATALTVISRALFGVRLQTGFHYQMAGYDIFMGEVVIAIAILVIIALLAIYCKKLLQGIQTVFGIIMLLGVVAVSLVILPHIDLHTFFSSYGAAGPMKGIFTIIILAPWAFVGFEVVSLETAHFKFQTQRSRWLIAVAILVGGYIYIAMTVAAVSVVPDGYASWQEYLNALGSINNYAAIPTFNAAKMLMGDAGMIVMGVTVVSAVITSVIGFYRASTRILTNMAEDQILTESFKKPAFCFLFVMIISVMLSLFGRNVLAWVVDLSSFGAIIAFGYTSAATWKTARGAGDRRMTVFGISGLVISIIFGLTQLVPYMSSIETMDAESYFLLAMWCLLGFAFYWRTMRQSTASEAGSEHITITSLFTLLFYSILVWYIKMIFRAGDYEAVHAAAAENAVILFAVVIFGLAVMLLIHSQLRKRQTMLEREKIHAIEGSRAKSQFLFNMSHDIRTPMNAILGFAHLGMQEGLTAEEKDVFLQKIDASGDQLLAIINDVLDMSRIENNKIEIDPVRTDFIGMFHEMRDLFAGQMHEKNIDFSLDTSGIEDRFVLCDKNRFSRVVLNLLSNACKFTPEEGAVSVIAKEISRTGEFGTYEVRVKDTGIGMSAEFTEDLFKPFERERTSTVSGIQGTGLGMSISKALLDLMGGYIDVHTEEGKGTEFIITLSLPIVDAPAGQTGPVEKVDIDYSKIRILLVEDNEINMEIADMILEQAGITVEKAENGQIAVDMVAASAPGYYDLILMDVQMPVMDGYTATRTIRGLENRSLADIPIIAMTANAFAEDIRAAEEAGMQAHIAKPVDIESMMGTVSRVLSSRQGCNTGV